MSVDNRSDHPPTAPEHAPLEPLELSQPLRQILFIGAGLEEAKPPRIFEGVAGRYEAACTPLWTNPIKTALCARTLLETGVNVVVPTLINNPIEREGYQKIAEESGVLAITLCMRSAADKQESIIWPDHDFDDSVFVLHRPDRKFSLMLIDRLLERRFEVYQPVEG